MAYKRACGVHALTSDLSPVILKACRPFLFHIDIIINVANSLNLEKKKKRKKVTNI